MQYFFNPRSQYIATNGRPASLGRLSFYESGTQTLKAVFAEDGVTPIANPVVLDANGRSPAIKLSDSDYKVVLETYLGTDNLSNPVYTTDWTIDPYAPSSNSSSGGNNTSIIPDINTLINTDYTVVGDAVYVLGYYEPGDLGQGWFYWDTTSTATPDEGSVFNVIGGGATGRWLRQFDTDTIYPQQWGAMENIPGGTVSSRLLSMFAFADATNPQNTIVFPEQLYPVGGNISLTGVDTIVKFNRGARINRSGLDPTTVSISVKSLEIAKQCGGIVGTEVDLVISTGDLSDIPVSAYNPNSGIPDMFTKAEGNYNGRLVIDDGYVLSGARDFSLSNLYFIAGGYIELSSYTGNYTITRYTFEDDLVNLFRGETEQFLFEGVKTFEAQHLVAVPNLISSGDYDKLLSTVTRGGTRVASISWDYYSTYTITSAMTKSNTYRVEMIVADDSVVQFNNNAYFGFVKNGPGRKIFASVGGYPLLDQPVYPQWFGLTTNQNTGDETRNTSAVNDALETAALTKQGVVDCVNANVYPNTSIISPLPNDASKVLTLKNAYINIDASFTSTNAIETYGNFKLENVTIDGTGSAGKIALSIRGNTYVINSIITQVLDMVNQNSSSANSLIELKGCTISGTRLVYLCNPADYEVFTGNKFQNAPLTLQQVNKITVNDNEFLTASGGTVTNVTLNAPGLELNKWNAKYFLSERNVFINQDITNYDNYLVDYNNMSVESNIACQVKDNMLQGDINLKSTELEFRKKWTIDTNSGPYWNSSFPSELILHANPSPAAYPGLKARISPIAMSSTIGVLSGAGTLATDSGDFIVILDPNPVAGEKPYDYGLFHTNTSITQNWVGDVYFNIQMRSNSLNYSDTLKVYP